MKFICFPFEKHSASENMALDLSMLEANKTAQDLCFRVYGWTEPSITFGYSQAYQEVAQEFPPRAFALVRRATGGGIVDHRHDLTYALKIPTTHAVSTQRASTTYEELHIAIQKVFQEFGRRTKVNPCDHACDTVNKPPRSSSTLSACFVQPEPFDLMDNSTKTKLAGAAMKRNKQGLLIQGSIHLAEHMEVQSFATSLSQAFIEWLRPNTKPTQLPILEIHHAWLEKFQSSAWNQKR